MKELGVNLVTLGVFSWSSIEQREGEFDFSWLEVIMEKLHAAGIQIDMATGTASPPAWLAKKHPEMLGVTPEGVSFSHGGRQHFSPSSKAYRDYSLRFLEKLLERVAGHESIVMWHVNNEIGCHNPYDFGLETLEQFQLWLKSKYVTLDRLNEAWYTRFWSQSYGSFDEIPLPGFTSYGTSPNPGMELDFKRFSSDTLLRIYRRERDLIRKFDKETPITTNFMSMRHVTAMNYWEWASEVDLVSTDHYLDFVSSDRDIDLAFQSDLTRALAGGKQWLLMEHSTSAVNWQPVNPIKSTRQIVGDSLEHIFRGSQGAMFFQFRQSRGGSERFHSALVPAAGIDTRVGRALKELSSKIQDLGQLAADETELAKVAIVFDYEDQWVTQQANLPSSKLDYFQEVFNWYKALSQLGVRVDFIDKGESFLEFSNYEYVFAPMMHIVDEDLVQRILKFVESGGHFYATYFSGISDKNLQFSASGMGADFLDPVFGVRLEEFAPMLEQEGKLSNGLGHSLWREIINVDDQQTVVALFEDADELTGSPAIISKTIGSGRCVYVATSLDDNSLVSFLTNELNMSSGHQPVEVTRGKLQFSRDLSGQHKITDVMPRD